MWDSKPKLRGKAQTLHCVNTRAILHVKRIPCVVKYTDPEKGEVSLECQLILNDLNPSGTAIYSPVLIPLGTTLKFEFEDSPFKAPLLGPAGPRTAIRRGLPGSANVILACLQAPRAARETRKSVIDPGVTCTAPDGSDAPNSRTAF